ncbi:MAG: glycosyltransferase family 2 protein [Promethearchaeota archaeon]
MEILALILTWNNLPFFRFCLQQAFDFCDEVIVAEGCHYKKYPKHSTDGTVEFLNEMKDNPKLKIIDFEQNERNDIVQLKLRMKALAVSECFKPGNWIIQWDDDDFFLRDDFIKLKNIMKNTKYDTLVFNERRFIYNFRFNCYKKKAKGRMNIGGIQIDRITPGAKYRASIGKKTHPRLYYKNGKTYNKIKYLKDITLFHYCYVKPPERMKSRWEMNLERSIPRSDGIKTWVVSQDRTRFKDFMSIKWSDDEDIFNSKKIIEEFMNKKEFNVYNGKHPEILDKHPWRFVDDIRKIKG